MKKFWLVLALLAMTSPAFAQVKLVKPTGNVAADFAAATGQAPAPIKLTGNLEKDAQAVWKKIVAASNADLTYASALAGSTGTNAGKIRKQCWDAIITLNQQVNGASLKNPDGTPMVKPDPALFSEVEILAETIDNLSPQGALFTSCAGAAQLAKTNVLTFINSAVTGAAGIAAMPLVPGL